MSLTKITFSMIDGDIVQAKDYGAIGDGVIDDTAAIQAAPNVGVAGTTAKTRIANSVFTSSSILSGSAIVTTNIVARNNRINNFLNGIDYSYSTTAEVADNVCVNTPNPFITVGVVPFVNTDNFSR